MTKIRHGHKNDLGILGGGLDSGDRLSRDYGSRQIRAPGLATIEAAEKSAVVRPYVDAIRISRRYLDRRNGTPVQWTRNWFPVIAIVDRFPDPRRAGVHGLRVVRIHGDVHHPSRLLFVLRLRR